MNEPNKMETPELISIETAATRGVERLRQPQWSHPLDHLKIDIVVGLDGKPVAGPWTHLYAPFNQECNGRDPVSVLFREMDYEAVAWLPYTGPTHESEEYKAEQARFAGCLGQNIEAQEREASPGA